MHETCRNTLETFIGSFLCVPLVNVKLISLSLSSLSLSVVGIVYSIVMSAHADHTWAVSSQSQRQPRTYSPGARFFGTRTSSMMTTLVGQLPAHGPGLNPYLIEER